ncbi:MAG TPA: aromatic acid exporter family protein [Jatrophihabitans sp.]|nr:aromatic acid exporter family protein [Jatrophihabitans sp.]
MPELNARFRQWAAMARQRGPATIGRALRLSVAAVAAYGVALLIVADQRPVTAALTALLIVQVTLAGTLSDTLRRVLSVLAGVGIAIGVSASAGFTWWSLGALVVTAILVGQLLRLGTHLLEVPISAMLILAAGGAGSAATDRVIETLIGAAVAALLNLAVPPSTRTKTAGEAVEAFAARLADFLERISRALTEAPLPPEQAFDWLRELREITGDTAQVDRVLAEAQQSRRFNPRAVGLMDPVPDLRSGLDALEHSGVALRTVIRSIAEGMRGVIAGGADGAGMSDAEVEVRRAIADLLARLGRCIVAFGAVIRFGDAGGEDLAQTLAAAREAHAHLAELLLIDLRETTALWQVHGSLLAAVERVLAELDVEELARTREERRSDALARARTTTQAAQRLRSHARSVVVQNPRIRPYRRR